MLPDPDELAGTIHICQSVASNECKCHEKSDHTGIIELLVRHMFLVQALWDIDWIASEVWMLINQPSYVIFVWRNLHTVHLYELFFGMPKDARNDFPLRSTTYERVLYPGLNVSGIINLRRNRLISGVALLVRKFIFPSGTS